MSPLFDTQSSEGYNVLVPNKGTMISSTTEAIEDVTHDPEEWRKFWEDVSEDYC